MMSHSTDSAPEPAPSGSHFQYEPAKDQGLAPLERFQSVRREAGLVSFSAAWMMSSTLGAYFSAMHRLKVIGHEHLPKQTPFVMIANHASHFDALVLAAALPRSLRSAASPVAAGDVFFERTATSVASAMLLNAVPLWRKKVTRHALDDLRARLNDGRSILILFPEGARSRDGNELPFKPGLGRLVANTSVPVVPCHIDGAFKAFPPGGRLPRPVRITVRIGAPLDFADLPNAREGWDTVATRCRNAVFGLVGK
jgi:1-acyl-sn-glycerol-3-phosphate acyltransferase